MISFIESEFEKTVELGEVKFKCNKYQYIERYYIAYQNKFGY